MNFIDNLPNVTELNTKISADDTKVYTAINSIEDRDKLQIAIDNKYRWTQTWLLKLNEKNAKSYTLEIITNNITTTLETNPTKLNYRYPKFKKTLESIQIHY